MSSHSPHIRKGTHQAELVDLDDQGQFGLRLSPKRMVSNCIRQTIHWITRVPLNALRSQFCPSLYALRQWIASVISIRHAMTRRSRLLLVEGLESRELLAADSSEALVSDQLFSNTSSLFSLPIVSPELQNPGTQIIQNGSIDGLINLIANSTNNNSLTYHATAQTIEYYWDQQLGLSAAPLFMYRNWGGLNEKWFTGNSQPFYYMTPNGTLYLWRGGDLHHDVAIAHFSAQVYQNPSLLYDAVNISPAKLSINGNILTLNPNDSFVGQFVVIATVQEGTGGRDAETFFVNVAAPAPDVIPPTIVNLSPSNSALLQSPNHNFDFTFSEVITKIDATDLVLSGGGAVGAVVGDPVNLGGNTWRFSISNLVPGSFQVSLAPDADDLEDAVGNDLATITLNYNVFIGSTQHPPALNPIANQSVSNGYSNVVLNLVAIDPDNDPLHYSGSLQSIERYIDQKYNLSFSGNYYSNVGGLQEKWLQGTMGWYYLTPNAKLFYWLGGDARNAVFIEQLSPEAYENPSILFNALVATDLGTVNFNGNVMTINPSDTFSGRIAVSATVSDGVGGADSETFFVDIGPPAYQIVPPEILSISPDPNAIIDRSEAFIDVVFSKPMVHIDPMDLTLAGPAALHARTASVALVDALTWRIMVTNLADGHLNISLGSSVHGIEDLDNLALEPVSWSYQVDISAQGQAPVLDFIGPRTISGSNTLAIPLSISDPNNNALTLEATVQSVAYYWDQLLGLKLNGSLFANFGGKSEKWLLGADSRWYYITPQGDLYRWNGDKTLSNDEWLTRLPTQLYTHVEQLYQATNEQPAQAILDGDTLRITPNRGFVGDFYILVKLTDSHGFSDSEVVRVTVTA